MYFFSVAPFFEGMIFSGVVEHFRKFETRVVKSNFELKAQSRVASPPGDPKKCLKWYKFENHNECILSFTNRKGADGLLKYQFSLQSIWKMMVK